MIKNYLILVVVFTLLVFPFAVRLDFWIHIIIMCYYYAILASSWNLLVGYAGQMSFAQAAFSGIGAYTSALLVLNTGISAFIGIPIGGAVAAAVGYIIGFLCFRLRGPYLALCTIAFSETIRMIIMVEWEYTRGAMGLPVPWLFETTSRIPYYYTMLGLFLFLIYIIHKIINSRIGLFIRTIREDEDAASIMGVNTTKYKTLTFSISGFIAGIAGGFYAHYTQMLHPNMMLISEMAIVIAMTVIGGIGNLIGPILGAFLVEIVSEYIRTNYGAYHLVIFGVVFILTVRFARGGLVELIQKQVSRLQARLKT